MDRLTILLRLFVLIVLVWPTFVATLVYAARRPGISNGGAYWLKALGFSYACAILGPTAMLVLFMLFGVVAEMATIYTLLLGIPVFAGVPIVIALRASSTS